MKQPLVNRDPGDETQTSLFDSPAVCPSCQTTRPNLCQFDADVSHGHIEASRRRYRGCLNAPDPKTMEIPF